MSLRLANYARQQGFACAIMADATQAAKVQEAATAAQIPVFVAGHPEDLPLEPWLANPASTLAISIGAPWFFRPHFLEKTLRGALLNLHGTHLPKARGGTLFSWQILNGQRTGICLLHRMTEAFDAGVVVDFEEFIYPAHCRIPADFMQVYEEKNAVFLQNFLQKWLREGCPAAAISVQPEYLSTYWPRLRADVHGLMDWSWAAPELERFICAFDEPYAGARCRWRGQEIVVREAWAQAMEGRTHPFQWGLVMRNNGQWLTVAAQGGELLLCSVRDTAGHDLLPGIHPGDRLYTEPSDLEKARQRVIKTAQGLMLQPDIPQKP